MGRTPLSGWRMLRRLRAEGVRTHAFGYSTTFESCAPICARLARRIATIALDGDYVVIGHSLGGVLLRTALASLPAGVDPPRQLFLLGSPVQASRIAQALHRRWLFRILFGDCGQMLASPARMANIAAATVPTIAIIGVRGWSGRLNPFGDALNDGIVSVDETRADWAVESLTLPVVHTRLPSDRRVAEAIVKVTRRLT